MKSLYLIWKVCTYHFYRWKRNKRVVVSFLLAGILSFLLTEKIMNFSFEKGTVIQIVEPFVWSFGDGTSVLLVSLILILLFADMPLLDGTVPYALIRTNARIWTLGQMLYLTLSSFLYILYIFVITTLLCCKNAFIGNQWSDTAELLSYTDYSKVLSIPATLKTAQMSRPYESMTTIFILMLLYILISVFVMQYIIIKKGKTAGVIGIFMFHLAGFLLKSDFISGILGLKDKYKFIAVILRGWISPLSHVTFPMHNFGYDNLPRLRDSYLIFGCAIIFLLIMIIHAMRRYNFMFIGAEKQEGI